MFSGFIFCMSFRPKGLGLLLALAAGCGPSPGAGGPGPQPAPPPKASSEPTPATASPTPTASASTAPPEEPAPTGPNPRAGGDGKPVAGEGIATGSFAGSISQSEIRDVITQHGYAFDECYRIGAGKTTQFVATVTVKATIGPSGKVTVAEIKKSTAKNKKVDTCVLETFQRIRFSPPKGGATSVITFPIEFNGAEEVR
jgi:TonB family protein